MNRLASLGPWSQRALVVLVMGLSAACSESPEPAPSQAPSDATDPRPDRQDTEEHADVGDPDADASSDEPEEHQDAVDEIEDDTDDPSIDASEDDPQADPVDEPPVPRDVTESDTDATQQGTVNCAPLGEDGNALCHAGTDRCSGVFYDRSGCDAYCARAGLICLSSYEDDETPGACAPDLERDELTCRNTGHRSDYCVCGPSTCRPNCAGRVCGTDGCGGVCGACPDSRPCLDGQCATSERPWEDLLFQRVGFGRETTGGAGGELCVVTHLGDSGEGSFRACAESDAPRWIRFDVSGTIRLNNNVMIGSNTTVDGRGQNIIFESRGLYINGKNNVILHNIHLRNGGGGSETDAVQIINGARHIWVHRVTLENYPDGLIDITREATDVTISWSHFRDHDKVMLISADRSDTGDTVIRVTLHHNWFERTTQRHPRLRYGRVHAFNNYFDRWESYSIGSSQDGQVLSERNVYETAPRGPSWPWEDNRRDAFQTEFSADNRRGNIRSLEDLAIEGIRFNERNPGSVFNPANDYPYTAEPATEALRDRIRAGAGRRDLPWP